MAREKTVSTYRVTSGTLRLGKKLYQEGETFNTDINLSHIRNKVAKVETEELDKPFNIVKAGRRFQVVDADGNPLHEATLTKKQSTALVAKLTKEAKALAKAGAADADADADGEPDADADGE